MTYRIATIPGDGIGIEVVDATLPLLDDLAETHDFALETTRFDWSSARHIDVGQAMPDDATETLSSFDAILHGATGHPDVPDTVGAQELVLPIRRAFDHYVNLRPVYLFNEDLSPLSGYERGDIDIAWYRENTEGEYADVGGELFRGGASEVAIQCATFTRKGIERIAEAAFSRAEERSGHVISVTKSNAQKYGPVFWDRIVEEVSANHPDVESERMLVDAAAQHLVVQPDRFDVVVASNLFSDILTDLTAAVTGGLGLAPSANVNPETDVPGMFEPVHGSAPDIAGDGIANPLAEVLSAALMLDDLGESAAAEEIWSIVEAQLTDPDAPRTGDIGGDASTVDVVEDLRARL